jgi:nicotinate phosphoribosyltransferase
MAVSALSTDLYEITMMAAYCGGRHTELATFELSVRDLPANRGYLVAAGIEQALECLETLRFGPDEIAYLRGLPSLQGVPAAFFDDYLTRFRFTGEVWAVEEGTPVFPFEPLLRVTAPLPEAQLVETVLLAILMHPTSVASKASRVVEAARGRTVIEFGSRRAHGTAAGLAAARAAYLGGCDATSNVEAGFRYAIPVSGTMAHSWVMSFADEIEAFRSFAAMFGDRAIFLIDTYDTLEAARRIVSAGLRPAAVRLDSGDIVRLSAAVRSVLDAGGMPSVRIFVSGDLDEYRVAQYLAAGAPIDGFGVGTALSTSADAPSLGGIYKLVEVQRHDEWVPTMKLSTAKRSYPGRKQVWRVVEGGTARHDVLGLCDEPAPAGGVPLLRPVMRLGCRDRSGAPRLVDLRARCREAVLALPPEVRRIDPAAAYPVLISDGLSRLTQRLTEAFVT